MADKYYSVSIGETGEWQVTEGGATSGEVFEFRINDTAYGNLLYAIEALETIENYLMSKETSPIA